MQVKDLIVTGDAKILGNLYTKDGNVGAGGGAGGGEGGSSITYRLTKSGQTITLTGSDGSTSSVVDSDTTTSVDLSGYLPKSGGTMTGALNFKNGTWNTLGDDVYFGDNDTAGSFAIKGANGTTNLKMVANNSSAYGTLSWNGSQFASSNNFTAPAFIENGTALSSKYAPIGHSHDDRYFTESEINSKLSGYAASSHSHGQIQNGTVGIKVSDSNEVSFMSNSNYIYFGYDNRMGSSVAVDTYKFGKHSGSANSVSGTIECGTVIEGGTALSRKYARISHSHDDRYFTESEINTKLNAKAPQYQYSTTDLTAGSSSLATGTLYFVYE